ncbi:hypothetical protein [Natronorarus salvus]|uniref:hypothetical protein n=1 Tax=Natronorarus salvus TaxID=3117733 RepID=UPI002F26B2B4
MLQDILDNERLYRAIVPLTFGVLYGTYHYVDNKMDGDSPKASFDAYVYGKTVLASAGAALIVTLRGDDLTFDAIDALIPLLIVIVDDKLNQGLGWGSGDDGEDRGHDEDSEPNGEAPVISWTDAEERFDSLSRRPNGSEPSEPVIESGSEPNDDLDDSEILDGLTREEKFAGMDDERDERDERLSEEEVAAEAVERLDAEGE